MVDQEAVGSTAGSYHQGPGSHVGNAEVIGRGQRNPGRADDVEPEQHCIIHHIKWAGTCSRVVRQHAVEREQSHWSRATRHVGEKFYNHGVLSCRGMDSRLGVLEDDGVVQARGVVTLNGRHTCSRLASKGGES